MRTERWKQVFSPCEIIHAMAMVEKLLWYETQEDGWRTKGKRLLGKNRETLILTGVRIRGRVMGRGARLGFGSLPEQGGGKIKFGLKFQPFWN